MILPMIAPVPVSVAISARARLPVVEFDRKQIERPRARVRPFPQPKSHLNFSAWSLYQAAKKAELACSFTSDQIDHLAGSFANEHHGLFQWNNHELRLTDGVTDMYETAAQGSRSRLIGEGMLLLTMQAEGYAFWDRLDLLVKRALRRETNGHPESVKRARLILRRFEQNKKGRRSDFVLENRDRQSALAEAKGSFVSPYAASTIKQDLSDGLKQLAATKPLIAPQPQKSYVVGTYLREANDQNGEGSLIALVDPEGREDTDLAVELPDDWIRRGNYAAWLLGMGLTDAANALRNGTGRDGVTISLPIKRVGGRDYACAVTGAAISPRHFRGFMREMQHHWPHWPEWFVFGPWRDALELSVIGLRVDVLDTISRAIAFPVEADLLGIEPQFETATEQFEGSVMPDGSMCGSVTADSFRETEFREFTL